MPIGAIKDDDDAAGVLPGPPTPESPEPAVAAHRERWWGCLVDGAEAGTESEALRDDPELAALAECAGYNLAVTEWLSREIALLSARIVQNLGEQNQVASTFITGSKRTGRISTTLNVGSVFN